MRRKKTDLDTMMTELLESQKNNQDSVSKLSNDTKEILKKLSKIESMEIEIDDISKRILKLEKNHNWGFRLIASAIFLTIISLLVGIKTNQVTKEHLETQITYIDRQIQKHDSKVRHRIQKKASEQKDARDYKPFIYEENSKKNKP